MSAQKKRRQKNHKGNRKKITALIVALVIFLTLVISTISTLTYSKVYEGVFIEGESVSGLTEEELKDKIPELLDLSEVYEITLNIGGATETLSTLALAPALDADKMTEMAFMYGRQKKGLFRLSEIFDLKKNNVNVPYILSFDEFELQKTLNKISETLEITAVDNTIEIGTDSLTITRGVKGLGIDYNDVKTALNDCILNGKREISVSLKDINPEEITVDFIKRHVFSEAQDATYTISNHRLMFTESHPGVKLNEREVKRAIKEYENSKTLIIPAKITQPKVSTEELKNSIVGDELGTYTTDYSSSSSDRAHNISLASGKINGYVLAPGEEFSYNDVVGPRTVERGFKMANVYVGNTVQPGIGGGICQVSSTLFNAVVFADLEITERRNHSLPVSYAPMGRDATVSYGAIDFKFKNNTSKPIEIRVTCENRKNTVSIYGTDENPEREIKFETEKTGTSAPKVVKKEDNTIPEGTIKVESEGSSGSSYTTYKVVYENGVVKSRDVLCKSVYKGKDRVELVGTLKEEPEPSATPSASPEPTPAPTEAPAPTPSVIPTNPGTSEE